MWHRRGFFPIKGLFILFVLFSIFGGTGKSVFPGFFILLILFWIFVPAVGSAVNVGRRHRKSARFEPAREARRVPAPAPPPIRVEQIQVRPAAQVRSLADLPSSCKACGGPVTETTVDWRGSRALCGYCGSGFTA